MLVPSEPKRDLPSGNIAKRAVVPGFPGAGGRMTRFLGVGFSIPEEIPLWRLLCRGSRIVVFIYGPKIPIVSSLSSASGLTPVDYLTRYSCAVQEYWDGLEGRIGLLYYCPLN